MNKLIEQTKHEFIPRDLTVYRDVNEFTPLEL